MESNSLMLPATEVQEDEEVTPVIIIANNACMTIRPTVYNITEYIIGDWR